jgi:leader peptidase (prepilin peptidase)/N-methyltransferase
MKQAMYTLIAGVSGAMFGSFLNVVTYRLPRGESIVAPGSHCTSCGQAVRPYDNIPILSWLLLRGHCRSCDERISARYPIVEALVTVLCIAVVLARHSAADVALGATAVLILVPAALIDLEHRRIPNVLTAVGAIAALALGSALDPSGEPTRLLAGAAAGGVFLAVALVKPKGMGMGDVKLVGVLGLLLGSAVIPAVFIALFAGIGIGGVVIRRHGASVGRKTQVPFGPFLALGGLTAVFVGHSIVQWYLHSVI